MKERIIRAFAGTLILISILLVVFTGQQNWLWLTAFVGINLLQASLTKWCLLETILEKMGFHN